MYAWVFSGFFSFLLLFNNHKSRLVGSDDFFFFFVGVNECVWCPAMDWFSSHSGCVSGMDSGIDSESAMTRIKRLLNLNCEKCVLD